LVKIKISNKQKIIFLARIKFSSNQVNKLICFKIKVIYKKMAKKKKVTNFLIKLMKIVNNKKIYLTLT